MCPVKTKEVHVVVVPLFSVLKTNENIQQYIRQEEKTVQLKQVQFSKKE